MKEARGQNKIFQNASLLMYYCSFAIEQLLILKNQSERQAIELLLKVQTKQIADKKIQMSSEIKLFSRD